MMTTTSRCLLRRGKGLWLIGRRCSDVPYGPRVSVSRLIMAKAAEDDRQLPGPSTRHQQLCTAIAAVIGASPHMRKEKSEENEWVLMISRVSSVTLDSAFLIFSSSIAV